LPRVEVVVHLPLEAVELHAHLADGIPLGGSRVRLRFEGRQLLFQLVNRAFERQRLKIGHGRSATARPCREVRRCGQTSMVLSAGIAINPTSSESDCGEAAGGKRLRSVPLQYTDAAWTAAA